MDRSLYIAMSGAKQTLLAQTANANNLANSQTVGFKSDFQQFRAMPVFGPGFPSRVYAMTERPGTNLNYGPIQTTGRGLDVAIKGDGWIKVEGENGQEAYTRAGDLHITQQGFLLTGTGLKILGEADEPIIIPPADKIEIGRDGTISIIPLGDDATTLAVIESIKLVKPELDNLEKGNDGLMYAKNGEKLPASAEVSLITGALEGSNVSAIEALVEMIELARNFELQIKVMQNVDENSGVSARLMQMA